MSHPSVKLYYLVFVVLLVLLAVTVGAAELDLGRLNFPVAVLIASTKAVLILLYFMHLRYSLPLVWMFSLGSLFFLAILFALTLSDYYSRDWLKDQGPPDRAGVQTQTGISTAL